MKQLERLKELYDKATEGPLRIERRDYDSGAFNYIVYGVRDFAWCLDDLDINAKNNAEFIVESHKMLPRLIEALEKCMEQRDYEMSVDFGSMYNPDLALERYNQELEKILEGES